MNSTHPPLPPTTVHTTSGMSLSLLTPVQNVQSSCGKLRQGLSPRVSRLFASWIEATCFA